MDRRTFLTALAAAPGVAVSTDLDAELQARLAHATPGLKAAVVQLLRVVDETAAQRDWLEAEDARLAARNDPRLADTGALTGDRI